MDLQRLQQALIAADRAGDTEAAGKLAAALRRANTMASNPGEYDPSSPEFKAKYGAQGSAMQNLAAGAGKFPVDMARGVGQMLGITSQQSVDDARARDAALMDTRSGKVGNFIGGVMSSIPSILVPGANTALGATAVGGLMGAATPTATGESRTVNTLFGAGGGLAGYGAGKLLGRVIGGKSPPPNATGNSQATATGSISPGTASSNASVTGSVNTSVSGGPTMGTVGPDPSAGLNSAMKRAMEAGQQLGFRTTPGQATGSRALQQMEARLESQPLTSGPFNALKSGNQSTMNTIFARALGESSDVLDDATVGKFMARADKVYADVADDVPRVVDPNAFLSKLSQVESETEGLIPGGISSHPIVQRLMDYASKGEVTGQQAQQLRSQIGKAAQQQMTSQAGNRELGIALFDLQDIADDWLAQGLSGERKAALDAVRGQYRTFRLLTKSGAINPSTGNASGAKLANTLQRADEKGFLGGRNQSDLYNAARFAQAFRPIVGDSGTATRMPQGMFEVATSIPLNVAARSYLSTPGVSMALRTQAAANAAGQAVRPILAPLQPVAPYLPKFMTGAGGLFGTYAAGQ